MVQLSISVGQANAVLWLVTEVFLLLVTNTATNLIARRSVNNRLLRKETVQLNAPRDIVDIIPYNGDLFLAGRRLKFMLTFYRIIIIAISLYIGASLDGEPETNELPVLGTLSSTFLAPEPGDLTLNSGEDINAMAKLSCLRILDNNNLVLFKSYATSSENILCEDGEATPTTNILLKAEIRASFRTWSTGLDMSELQMFRSKFQNSSTGPDSRLELNPNVLTVNAMESGSPTGICARIVLMDRLPSDMCLLGIWRSSGNGFAQRVDLKLEAPCTLQIVALERLLLPKPEFLPPRMAFFYQVVDSVLVYRRVTEAPAVKDTSIVATLPLAAIILTVVFAVISSVAGIAFREIVRRGKVRPDLASVKGIAEVLSGSVEDKQIMFRWAEDRERVVFDDEDQRTNRSTGSSRERV